MIPRILIVVIANAIFLAAVFFYVPVDGLLQARGFTKTQISALHATQSTDTDIADASQPTTQDRAAKQTQSGKPTVKAKHTDTHPKTTQTKPATRQAKQPEAQKMVATDTINVRAGQSTNNRVVGQVHKGDVVTVVKDPGGQWIRIHNASVTGWAYRPLFKKAQ